MNNKSSNIFIFIFCSAIVSSCQPIMQQYLPSTGLNESPPRENFSAAPYRKAGTKVSQGQSVDISANELPAPSKDEDGTASGPFGLIFGQLKDDVKYKKLSNLDFRNGDDKCVRESLSVHHGVVPDSMKINLNDLYGIGGVPVAVYTSLTRNALKVDFSKNDLLSGGVYMIPALGLNMKVCLTFYKSRLFLVHVPIKEYISVSEELSASLNSKYGEPDSACGRGFCMSKWVTESNTVLVTKVSGIIGGLTYNYAPIKSSELRSIVDIYWDEYKKRSDNSPF